MSFEFSNLAPRCWLVTVTVTMLVTVTTMTVLRKTMLRFSSAVRG